MYMGSEPRSYNLTDIPMYIFAIYSSEGVHTYVGLLLILASLNQLTQPIFTRSGSRQKVWI